jgi:arylsulfatase A-like enzyme
MKPILTLLALTALFCGHLPAAEKPNILVILADDVGWGDAGCYGATKVKTPNIDRLAREGQRFENSHASAAVCTPTRYSLITGQYSWRQSGEGLNKGVSSGDSPLLIPTTMTTAPGLLKQAGYRTALIGKWHLGFGETKPDYNKELRPGPLEIGFDEFFGIPATNDRMPIAFVRDHRVVGRDPADPISISYNEAEAKSQGLSAWAAGRNRIGWAKGGKSAWWKDTEISDTLTRECVQFIERNSRAERDSLTKSARRAGAGAPGNEQPFFLLFTPHNVHAPAIPGPRFAGTSGLGNRADMLQELDASIGELLQTLDRLGLAKDTLVIYSSDNGAYVNDEKGHRPTGPFRGKKSQLWEGGTRVPFIVRWPARIQPGVSQDIASTIDVPATVCAAAGITLPKDALPDSFNLLPAMLGEKDAPKRDHLILMSGNGDLAIRDAQWKYIPDLAVADGWYAAKKKNANTPNKPALFDLSKDPGETTNLFSDKPEIVKELQARLEQAKATTRSRP